MFPLFDLRKSGTEEAKFTSSLRIVPLDSNLFVTFARRLSADLSAMVKWFGFFHNYSFFLFKFTKDPPLDQIFIPLIWMTIRYLTYF